MDITDTDSAGNTSAIKENVQEINLEPQGMYMYTHLRVINTFISPVPCLDPLEVCLGDRKGQHVLAKVPSEAALNEFQQITACGPSWEPSKSAKSLMAIFWSDEELAESCCTYAKGRKLLNQRILLGIKCRYNIMI